MMVLFAAESAKNVLPFLPFNIFLLVGQVFVAQNRVRAIEGFEGLTRLRKLDLGANRIRCASC